jgi:hypothetical protein
MIEQRVCGGLRALRLESIPPQLCADLPQKTPVLEHLVDESLGQGLMLLAHLRGPKGVGEIGVDQPFLVGRPLREAGAPREDFENLLRIGDNVQGALVR